MANENLPQIAYLSQQLSIHLKSVHMHHAKALDEAERARKVLVEMLDVYNQWKIKAELGHQE